MTNRVVWCATGISRDKLIRRLTPLSEPSGVDYLVFGPLNRMRCDVRDMVYEASECLVDVLREVVEEIGHD